MHRRILVIIDAYDSHHCVGARHQIESNIRGLQQYAAARRDEGYLIVHAPGGRTSAYSDHPSRTRLRVSLIKRAVNRERNHVATPPGLELPTLTGCVCNSVAPCLPKRRVWTKQHASIVIERSDVVTDSLRELRALMIRAPQAAAIVGFHLNRCVMTRSLGWFRLSSWIRDTVIVDRLVWSYAPPEEDQQIRTVLRDFGVPLV